MAKQSINTLKNWFKTGLKPVQQQFWDWLDSYRHLDDDIPIDDVSGLQSELDSKTDDTPVDNVSYLRRNKIWVDINNSIARNTVKIIDDLSPALPNVDYLADASVDEISVELPTVIATDMRQYYFTLSKNSNHCNITVIGGTQLIGGKLILSLSTENAHVSIKANGVNGYDIISDERQYYRIIEFTDDLNLLSGIESGGRYTGIIPDATEKIVIIQDWSVEHIGDHAFFAKGSGVNSSILITSEDTTFRQVITVDNTGIEVIYGKNGFEIGQDSRGSDALVSLNFYPTPVLSALEITYYLLVNNSADPAYPAVPGATFPTPPITSEVSQSIGFFINDAQALQGLIAERGINAFAQIKLAANYNRLVAIKFKYYEYTVSTNTLNPVAISETTFSEFTSSQTFIEKIITGLLPVNDWTDKTLVIELIAKKSATGGDNPILDFLFGGAAPSKTTVNLPSTSISHDSLSGVMIADTLVSKGHIDNKYPLQFPELTTAERDAIPSPNNGMKIFNVTSGTFQKYIGGAWVEEGGGLADAPSDGKTYGRKDAAWAEVTGGGGGVTIWNAIANASSTAANVITVTNQTEFNKANSGDAVRYTITGANAGIYRGYIYAKSAWGGSSGTYTILGPSFASGELTVLDYSNLTGIVNIIKLPLAVTIGQSVVFTKIINKLLLFDLTVRKNTYLAGFISKVEIIDTGTITNYAILNLTDSSDAAISDTQEYDSINEFITNILHAENNQLSHDIIEVKYTPPIGTPNYDTRNYDIDLIFIEG